MSEAFILFGKLWFRAVCMRLLLSGWPIDLPFSCRSNKGCLELRLPIILFSVSLVLIQFSFLTLELGVASKSVLLHCVFVRRNYGCWDWEASSMGWWKFDLRLDLFSLINLKPCNLFFLIFFSNNNKNNNKSNSPIFKSTHQSTAPTFPHKNMDGVCESTHITL